MQGHESDVVILDWVNKYGDNLGFLKDDRRANVALTRARACLIIVLGAPAGDEFLQ
jgi:superfamily I DNA and/or RNA helicase